MPQIPHMSTEYRDGSRAGHPPADEALVAAATARAEAHIRREQLAGWDPYDALKSPLFSLPGVGRSRHLRFATQQVIRRLPVNIRPLLAIPKGLNPVTIGLVLGGYAELAAAEPARAGELGDNAARLVGELERLVSQGYRGACWGYDFPWQSRATLIPAYAPTIVATAFVTNGLFAAYERFGIEPALDLCASAAEFVLHDLHRTPGPDDSFCWSYSPLDTQCVLNATAKGSRLCAQVWSVRGGDHLAQAAEASLRYVAAHQRPDGAWPYAVGDSRSWVDNFHTGYVLDALDEWRRRTGSDSFDERIRSGWDYYRANLFEPDGRPRYYDRELYPIDSTACGQAMLTLVRFGDLEFALRVATGVVEGLQRRDGGFAYRRYRHFTNSIPYMRWSTAWIFAGLTSVLAAAREARGAA